jgi:hypothetical protein
MPRDHPALVKLRALIATLPETSEKISHGSPTFWGGKKTFASFHDNHHGDGRVAARTRRRSGRVGSEVIGCEGYRARIAM